MYQVLGHVLNRISKFCYLNRKANLIVENHLNWTDEQITEKSIEGAGIQVGPITNFDKAQFKCKNNANFFPLKTILKIELLIREWYKIVESRPYIYMDGWMARHGDGCRQGLDEDTGNQS